MRLQTMQAIYADGRLIFADPEFAPRNGAEVVVTYLGQAQQTETSQALTTLRGRGKGEQLVTKLLASRHKDRDHDERTAARLRS